MRKLLFTIICTCAMFESAVAQTPAQAQTMYQKGDYDNALTAYQKLLKAQPSNGVYALRYGVCLIRTGNPQDAINHLQLAIKKKVTGGQSFLAEAYNALYLFEDAVDMQETYITELEKRKKSTEEAEEKLDLYRKNLRMIKAVEDITVIDSVVVDKKHFLSAYKISPDAGSLSALDNSEYTIFQNELGNKVMYSEVQNDGKHSILVADKLEDKFGEGILLPSNINSGRNAAFPFQEADGITTYFAADGPESMGGYDIFVTRAGNDVNTYLHPENMGMPFNSPYNDYMYAIDEYTGIGWFASDRFQPEGKVCVYAFIPNSARVTIDYENTDKKELARLAQLKNIQATQKNQAAVKAAKERLAAMISESPEEVKHTISFVISDTKTYYEMSDFKSPQARQMFQSYQTLSKKHKELAKQLDNLRTKYATGSATEKKALRDTILTLENQVQQMETECLTLAKQIRNLELKS